MRNVIGILHDHRGIAMLAFYFAMEKQKRRVSLTDDHPIEMSRKELLQRKMGTTAIVRQMSF